MTLRVWRISHYNDVRVWRSQTELFLVMTGHRDWSIFLDWHLLIMTPLTEGHRLSIFLKWHHWLKVTDWASSYNDTRVWRSQTGIILIMMSESGGHRLSSSYNDTRDWRSQTEHLLIMTPVDWRSQTGSSSYNDTRVTEGRRLSIFL